jgi:hypothetical protein
MARAGGHRAGLFRLWVIAAPATVAARIANTTATALQRVSPGRAGVWHGPHVCAAPAASNALTVPSDSRPWHHGHRHGDRLPLVAAPSTPPREITLWTVRRGTRHARALIRQHPLGRELVVLVGEDIG